MSFDPSQLAALDAVLRLGSFDAAAAELYVTPSAISQRILGTSKRWEELMALNGISDPTRIRVGQVLKLPRVGLGPTEPILLASAQVTR